MNQLIYQPNPYNYKLIPECDWLVFEVKELPIASSRCIVPHSVPRTRNLECTAIQVALS